jgi:hypothetical protein
MCRTVGTFLLLRLHIGVHSPTLRSREADELRKPTSTRSRRWGGTCAARCLRADVSVIGLPKNLHRPGTPRERHRIREICSTIERVEHPIVVRKEAETERRRSERHSQCDTNPGRRGMAGARSNRFREKDMNRRRTLRHSITFRSWERRRRQVTLCAHEFSVLRTLSSAPAPN